MKELLQNVLLTLDCIEVKGKTNLDYMLGVMLAVQKVIDQMESEEEGARNVAEESRAEDSEEEEA